MYILNGKMSGITKKDKNIKRKQKGACNKCL